MILPLAFRRVVQLSKICRETQRVGERERASPSQVKRQARHLAPTTETLHHHHKAIEPARSADALPSPRGLGRVLYQGLLWRLALSVERFAFRL